MRDDLLAYVDDTLREPMRTPTPRTFRRLQAEADQLVEERNAIRLLPGHESDVTARLAILSLEVGIEMRRGLLQRYRQQMDTGYPG